VDASEKCSPTNGGFLADEILRIISQTYN